MLRTETRQTIYTLISYYTSQTENVTPKLPSRNALCQVTSPFTFTMIARFVMNSEPDLQNKINYIPADPGICVRETVGDFPRLHYSLKP